MGSKDDLDLYAYVGGDPINRSDPTGTQMFPQQMYDDPGTMPSQENYRSLGNTLADAGEWLDERSDILFDPNIIQNSEGASYLGGAAIKDLALVLKLGRTEATVEAEIVTKVHGNTANDAPATLYKKYDSDGNFLKHGVTQHVDPAKRYTAKQINGGTVVREDRGPRKDMLKKERDRVETDPGPDNKEPWAGKRKNGYQ